MPKQIMTNEIPNIKQYSKDIRVRANGDLYYLVDLHDGNGLRYVTLEQWKKSI